MGRVADDACCGVIEAQHRAGREPPSHRRGHAADMVTGTLSYLAPEALTATGQVGPASDLYALAAVGFTLLTGARLFEGRIAAEVWGQHIHTEPRAPSAISPFEVPAGLDAVLLRCLAKDPDQRVRSARRMAEALQALGLEPYRGGEDFWDMVEAARSSDAAAPATPRQLSVDLHRR